MKREKTSIGIEMPRLFGILWKAPTISSESTDANAGLATEEINIDAAKAEIDRAKVATLQASRLTFA